MALNVISNFAANVAHRNLKRSDLEMTDSLAKLSAGKRVISAKDDAASMAIGSRLEAEVKALAQAAVNSGQAVSMLQVADGAMARANDILLRMKTLSVQAGSGQLSGTERGMLDTEYQQLVSEIDRIALDTEFNGVQLTNGAIVVDRTNATDLEIADGVQDIVFRGAHTATNASLAYDSAAGAFTATTAEGTFSGTIPSGSNDGTTMTTGTVVTLSNSALSNKIDLVLNTAFSVNSAHATGTLALSGSSSVSFTYKVGTGTSATADQITVTLNSISAASLSLGTTNVLSAPQADVASSAITIAVDTLNLARANIATTLENMEAARSNLLDLDIAAEMSRFTSRQILVQAGIAMLAQANQTPQNLLRLFQ